MITLFTVQYSFFISRHWSIVGVCIVFKTDKRLDTITVNDVNIIKLSRGVEAVSEAREQQQARKRKPDVNTIINFNYDY